MAAINCPLYMAAETDAPYLAPYESQPDRIPSKHYWLAVEVWSKVVLLDLALADLEDIKNRPNQDSPSRDEINDIRALEFPLRKLLEVPRPQRLETITLKNSARLKVFDRRLGEAVDGGPHWLELPALRYILRKWRERIYEDDREHGKILSSVFSVSGDVIVRDKTFQTYRDVLDYWSAIFKSIEKASVLGAIPESERFRLAPYLNEFKEN